MSFTVAATEMHVAYFGWFRDNGIKGVRMTCNVFAKTRGLTASGRSTT
jgi:hypothetical protein